MAFPFPQPPHELLDCLFPGLDLDHPISNQAYVGSGTLTFESNLDLMIGDPLSQALDPNSQLLVAPQASPDAAKPYRRFPLLSTTPAC
ncbi:MAG: hypothetical protein CAF42_012685 [Nitrospira sp. CG24B]|jgi:hypothetical protein|nr:MAG: hypothetical protein CAF42_012685 [Nitrospira sp. CG24B]TKB60062.1 MAG: hypothetical protein E8D48_13980 [Nitrospira sp.]